MRRDLNTFDEQIPHVQKIIVDFNINNKFNQYQFGRPAPEHFDNVSQWLSNAFLEFYQLESAQEGVSADLFNLFLAQCVSHNLLSRHYAELIKKSSPLTTETFETLTKLYPSADFSDRLALCIQKTLSTSLITAADKLRLLNLNRKLLETRSAAISFNQANLHPDAPGDAKTLFCWLHFAFEDLTKLLSDENDYIVLAKKLTIIIWLPIFHFAALSLA